MVIEYLHRRRRPCRRRRRREFRIVGVVAFIVGLGLCLLDDDDIIHRWNNSDDINCFVVFAVSAGNTDNGSNCYYHHRHHHQPPHRQQQTQEQHQHQHQRQYSYQRPTSSSETSSPPSSPSSRSKSTESSSNFRTQYQMIDDVHEVFLDPQSASSSSSTMNPLWRETHVFTGERRGPVYYYHHRHHHDDDDGGDDGDGLNRHHHQQQQQQQDRIVRSTADDDDYGYDDDDDDRWMMSPSLLREEFVLLPHRSRRSGDRSDSYDQKKDTQQSQKEQQKEQSRTTNNHRERPRVRGGGGGGENGDDDDDSGISDSWIKGLIDSVWMSSNKRRSRNRIRQESQQAHVLREQACTERNTTSPAVQPTTTNETRWRTPTSMVMRITNALVNLLPTKQRQGVGNFYGGATTSTSTSAPLSPRPRRAGRLDVDLFVPSTKSGREKTQTKSPRRIRYRSSTTSRSQSNTTSGVLLPDVGSENGSSEKTRSTSVDTKSNFDELTDQSMSSDLIHDSPRHENQQQQQKEKEKFFFGKTASTVSNQMMALVQQRIPSGDVRNTGVDDRRSKSNEVEKCKNFQMSMSIDPMSSVRLARQLLVVVVTSASAFVGTLKLIAPMIVARRCLNIVLFVFYDHMNGRFIRTTYTKRMVHLQQFEVLAGLRSVGRIVFQTVVVGMAGWIMSLLMDLAPCVIEPVWICNACHACAWVATVYSVEWFTQTWLTAQERYHLIKIRPTQFSSTLATRKHRRHRNDSDRLRWDRALMPGAATTSTTSTLRSTLAEIPQMIFQRLQDPEEWVDSMLRPILGGGQFARYYSSNNGNPRSMRPTSGTELDALLFPSTWTPLRLLLSLGVGVAIFKTYEAGGSGMFDDSYRPSVLRRLVMRSFVFQEAIHSEWLRVFVHERRVALGSIFSLVDLIAYIAMVIPIVAVSGPVGVFLLFPPLIARLVSGWMNFLLYHDRYWNGSLPGLRYWPFVRKNLNNKRSK